MRSMVEGAHVQSSDAPPTILRSLREARMVPPPRNAVPTTLASWGAPRGAG